MKKCLILTMIGLMLGIQSANSSNDPEYLEFGEVWMEGSHCAELVQRLHVEVTNFGNKTYMSKWVVKEPWFFDPSIAPDKMNGPEAYYGKIEDITIEPGETKDVIIYICFTKEGHHDVYVWQYIGAIELFSYSVDIDEYRTPRAKGEIKLDMLEQTEDGNILYGDFNHFKITGTATITNEEDFWLVADENVYMYSNTSSISCVISPWFGDNPLYTSEDRYFFMANEIAPGETITKEFSYEFKAVPEEGKEYEILLCVENYLKDKYIARIPFKVRQCTNTYWTADGHVKPLPVDTNQVLKVPAEALAVDMRGQYETNTTFSIDVSEANPNCLYYLGFLDNVPQGFSSTTNVIRDYEAHLLCVDTNYDYFCPMPFRAKTAICQYTSVSEVQDYQMSFAGTLVLPFNATQGYLYALNEPLGGLEVGFKGRDIQVFRFIGDDKKVMNFARVTVNHLNAYEPCLIIGLTPQMNFYAEDVMVPSTRPAITTGTNFDFIGHTTQVSTKQVQGDYHGVFCWNTDADCFYRSEEDVTVRPFSAMLYAKTPDASTYDRLKVVDITDTVDNHEGEGSTKIDGISDSPANHSTAVYSLSGQRVGTAEMHEGRLTVSGLRPGLYIIDGKKIVVK